jgi:shikimate dehydrogenase
MNMPLAGTTKVLAIIGCPVRHSLSPLMQNAALQACGLDYVYVPFEVASEGVSAAVAGLKVLGVAGFNVTIPYKTAVMPYLDDIDDSAVAAGAVNTVSNVCGRLIGYNTDGDGVVKSLAADLAFDPRNKTIVIIGAGGAARGAIAALCRAGARHIVIVNRTHDKAAELVSAMSARYSGTLLSIASGKDALQENLPLADLLVNTTSIGMNCESIPFLCLPSLSRTACVYDMIYSPRVTPLLSEAAGLGIKAANGLGMLAAQGELAFTIWTGKIPPSGLMRRALDAFCTR